MSEGAHSWRDPLRAALGGSRKALAVPECQSVRIDPVTLDRKCQVMEKWTLF